MIGDRQALAWILESRQMAFSEVGAKSARQLQPGDDLLLYTTRGCFGNPKLDRGRIIGQATVDSSVTSLETPVVFGARTFPFGCSLTLHRLTHFRTGVELSKHVRGMHAFPNPDAWSAYVRRTLVPLDDHDYDLIVRLLGEIAVEPSDTVEEYLARRNPPRSSQKAVGH